MRGNSTAISKISGLMRGSPPTIVMKETPRLSASDTMPLSSPALSSSEVSPRIARA